MARSYQIVEDKIAEADFFIEKIKDASLNFNFFECRNYLSAFLSASRSITFSLKASISDLQGFDEWYKPYEKKMKEDPVARYFLEARNLSQKVGYYPLTSGTMQNDHNGKMYVNYYFDSSFYPGDSDVPKTNVISTCNEYLTLLITIVYDCFQVFGPIIDS